MNKRADERLGSYSLGVTIGKGAAGVVWSATSPDHAGPVAIKILRDDLTDDPKIVSRFLREQQIFDAVDHPNVVKVFDVIAEERLGIVMELLEGGDLRSLIAAGAVGVSDSIDIATQVADGLAHIHDVGVLHRDLKPANVLVGGSVGDRTVKISDFGVSRLVGDAMTRTSTTIGTPLYMAPEATGPSGAGASSDVYALGAILYEMLVGSPPFYGEGTLAVILAHSQCPVPQLGGLTPELSDLVVEMLDKDPKARPSAADVNSRLVEMAPLLHDEMKPYAMSPLAVDATLGPTKQAAPVEGDMATGLLGSELRTIGVPLLETSVVEDDDPEATLWPAAIRHPALNPTSAGGFVSRHIAAIVLSFAALVLFSAFAFVGLRGDFGGTSELLAESDSEVAAGPERRTGDESKGSSQQATSHGSAASTQASPSSDQATSAQSSNANSSSSEPSRMTKPKEGVATRKGASGETNSTSAAGASTVPTSARGSTSTSLKLKAATDTSASLSRSTTSTSAAVKVVRTSLPSAILVPHATTTSTAKAATNTSKASTSTTARSVPTSAERTTTSAALPTTMASTTVPTTSSTVAPTTVAKPAGQQVAIVSGPSVVSVTSTSAVFRYTTNPVCATGSFTYRNQKTGAVVGKWVGDRGCFGPVHDGNTAWPGIVLEPGTTYSVSILLEGQPGNGTLATGLGRTTSSIVITTPG